MKTEVFLCHKSDLEEGNFKIFKVKDSSVGAIIYQNEIKCFLNSCPHAGAPVCQGYIDHLYHSDKPFQSSILLENSVLKCPWHGYEYEIATGNAVITKNKGLAKMETRVEDDKVYLLL